MLHSLYMYLIKTSCTRATIKRRADCSRASCDKTERRSIPLAGSRLLNPLPESRATFVTSAAFFRLFRANFGIAFARRMASQTLAEIWRVESKVQVPSFEFISTISRRSFNDSQFCAGFRCVRKLTISKRSLRQSKLLRNGASCFKFTAAGKRELKKSCAPEVARSKLTAKNKCAHSDAS